MLNTNVGASQRPSVVLPFVPDFVAGIARAAEGKYQVIDEGELRMGPRRVGYFISGSSRLPGELGECSRGRAGFESPEKPFTTTDFVPTGALNSDVAMVPQNA